MPTFQICSQGRILGHSALEHHDESMGVASGTFIPAPAYEDVRPIFELFAQAQTNEYYAARDSLGLTLVTPSGETIPTSFIHIEDYAREAPELPGMVQVSVQLPGGIDALEGG